MMKRMAVVMLLLAVCGYAIAGTEHVRIDETILPGVVDTSSTVGSGSFDRFAWFFWFTGDSAKAWLDYGFGNRWVTLDSVAFADTNAATTQYSNFIQLKRTATIGSDKTVHYDGFIFPKLRMRFQNQDTYGADSSSTDLDTLTALKAFIQYESN